MKPLLTNPSLTNDQSGTLKAGRHSIHTGPDIWLGVTVAALLSMGIVMTYSAVVPGYMAVLEIDFGILIKHMMHIAIGLALLLAAVSVRISHLQLAGRTLLFIGFLALLVLLYSDLGVEVNGGRRWIEISGFRFQPSEFMKLAAVIYFADYLSRKKDDLHLFKVSIINVGAVLGIIGLLLFESDFGTTALIIITVLTMMLLAGVRFWHISVVVLVASGLLALMIAMKPHRIERIKIYLDLDNAEPLGSGYQLWQSLIAIGRGEWFGMGIGNSIQKISYLPHAGNDFLIAIIGEELGAVGIFSVLTLYILLLIRAFSISRKAFYLGERFSGFLAQGIGVLLTFQAIIHICVNVGLLPTKGLTLPMMSTGGSSMLCSLAAIGLLFAVDRQNRTHPRVTPSGSYVYREAIRR